MNVEDFRSYCLSLKGVEERMPWLETAKNDYDRGLLLFSVCGKWFCFVNVDRFDFCTIKCKPGRTEELQERFTGVSPGWHMNKRHWMSVRFGGDVPDSLLLSLVREAYDLVVAALPKRQREALSL